MREWLADRIDDLRDWLGDWSYRLRYPKGRDVHVPPGAKLITLEDYARGEAWLHEDLADAHVRSLEQPNDLMRELPFKEP